MDITTISGLGEEALAPLYAAIERVIPAQRPAALLKAQGAVRAFVDAAAAGRTPDPAAEADPVRQAVFEVLAKAMGALPRALVKSSEEQADNDLEQLVKMETSRAHERLEKGFLNPLRAMGMRRMMGAARAARDSSMAGTRAGAGAARERGIDSVSYSIPGKGRILAAIDNDVRRLPARGGNMYQQKAAGDAAVNAHMSSGKRYARTAGSMAANAARGKFKTGVRRGALGAAAGGSAVGLGYAEGGRRRRRDQEG